MKKKVIEKYKKDKNHNKKEGDHQNQNHRNHKEEKIKIFQDQAIKEEIILLKKGDINQRNMKIMIRKKFKIKIAKK